MGFLNNSATFLGVLLTLNVLCIFYNPKGNFILGTLINQKDRFKKRLSNLENKLRKIQKSFLESDNYKSVVKIASGNSSSAQEAYALQYKSSSKINEFQIDISSFYGKMDTVEYSNEQFVSPLFSLFFGLLVFICDEFITYKPTWFTIIIFFLYIFTAISIAYWSFLWIAFFLRNNTTEESVNQKTTWIDENLGIFFGSLLKYFFCGITYSSIINYLPFYSYSERYTSFIILLAAIGPITLIGLIRLIYCQVKGNYSYLHILGHLLGFVLFAIIITLISIQSNHSELTEMGVLFNLDVLKIVIILFIMFNGVVFPLIFPYAKYCWYFFLARNQLRWLKKNVKKTIKQFNIDFTNFCIQKVNRDAKV